MDATKTPWIANTPSGVYFGYAALNLPETHPDRLSFPSAPPGSSDSATTGPHSSPTTAFLVFPMVMSIGFNPFFKNDTRSAEVHVLHRFAADFYGSHMRLLILGFIRVEKDYKSLDALIDDINFDCDVARRSLARPGWSLPRVVCPSSAVDGSLDGRWLVKELEPEEAEA